MARYTSLWSIIIEVSGLCDEEKVELRHIIADQIVQDEYLVLGTLFRAMDPSEYVLFVGDGDRLLITPWGFQCSSFIKYNKYNGERLPYVNELMPERFAISDSGLRSFFCMLELSIFKLLKLHEVSAVMGKDFHKLTLGKLSLELRKSGLLSEIAIDVLDNIIETRNEFSHAMKDVREVRYCDRPLAVSHSSKYIPWEDRDSTVQHFFIDDAFLVTEEIIDAYKMKQHKVVNGEILLEFMRGNLGLPIIQGQLIKYFRDCALEDKHWSNRQDSVEETQKKFLPSNISEPTWDI